MTTNKNFRTQFVEFALDQGVLRFGEFKTKAGRLSPYFFNAGLFNTGLALSRLGEFYANAISDSGISYDLLFGPAYKGIPLVSTTAVALARAGRNVPYCFNRKEVKDHGEGGVIVGAPMAGRVLILDDVISAGTSVRESVDLIRAAGAQPAAVVIALDRMERGSGEASAVQEVGALYGLPVFAIATLEDIVEFLAARGAMAHELHAVRKYREQYGVSTNGRTG
jgi:orotate phosphoribosyltransferase